MTTIRQHLKRFAIIAGAILATTILFASCAEGQHPPAENTVVGESSLRDEHLMDGISHGLHKITINDSTVILIYRGVESCTMLQIK